MTIATNINAFGSIVRRILPCVICIALVVPVLPTDLIEQRQTYKKAKTARAAGQSGLFRDLKEELQDYPLYVYLIYQDAVGRLSSYSADEAKAIQEQLQDSVLSEEFYRRWINAQAKAGRWNTFTENYVRSEDAIEHCKYLHALHRVGKTQEALGLVQEMWLVGESQPKECDPIFSVWIRNGNVTLELAWQRLQLALDQDSLVLARYLMRFFPQGNPRSRAQLLYDVHARPNLVKNQNRFPDDEWGRTALGHGLIEYAKDEGKAARSLWLQYRDGFNFEDSERAQIESEIAFWATREGELIKPVDSAFEPTTIERIADEAIAQDDWLLAHSWLSVQSAEHRETYKWRFWTAMSALKLGMDEALEDLTVLAQERTYYGFLAAQELGLPIKINSHVWENEEDSRSKFMADLRIARIFELYAVGDAASANKEWKWLIPQLDQEARTWVAHEIANIGWTYEGIQAAFSAGAFDLIDTRFPVLFLDIYKRNSHMTNVDLPVLLAITRQESAFSPTAISTVGARGLMQLMLSTARNTARNIGYSRPSSNALLNPETNIHIGSHHMVELLDEFDQNHALAYAAYNAGSHRVREWIKGKSGMDIRAWIETIPFHETRNYVKNVIAFSQVYAHLLDLELPVLAESDLTVP